MNISTIQVSTIGDRENFICQEILMLVTLGTLGRNKTYVEHATDAQKDKFRDDLKEQVGKLGKNYEYCSVNEEEHVENIQLLSDTMSK